MKQKILVTVLVFSFYFFVGATFVQGQGGGCGGTTGTACPPSVSTPIKLDNPFKAIGDGGLIALLQTIIDKIVLPIGGILAVLSFIYTGFMYVWARGNATEIKKAHDALLYSAVGTALLLGAYVISGIIEGTIKQFK